MAKLSELWDPVPRRLIAELRSERYTPASPACDLVGYLWAYRQIADGKVPSVRDLSAFAGWGNRRAARVLDEAITASNEWNGGEAERQEQHGARKRTTCAPPAHHLRTDDAPPAHLSEPAPIALVEEERTTCAPPAHHLRTDDAPPAHHRARFLLIQTGHPTAQETGDPGGSGEPTTPPSAEPPAPSIGPSVDDGQRVLPLAPTKPPPKTRKAPPPPDPAQDELYRAWHAHHSRAPKEPTPDTRKVLARILTEAGSTEAAVLLITWAHEGDCERARQLRGEAPWPGGDRTARTDLTSLSRQVVDRLEMARRWADRRDGKAPLPGGRGSHGAVGQLFRPVVTTGEERPGDWSS